jgi:hypothetical protein
MVTAAALAVPAGAAAVQPQPCTQLAVSPNFAHDGTVFCGGTAMSGFTPTGLSLFGSTDKGRSWHQATAAGLPYKSGDRMVDLVVSPLYASDHAVFVAIAGEGIYESTDAGATFTPLLPGAWPQVTPFVSGVAVNGAPRRTMLFAPYWLGGTPVVVDPGAHSIQPVPGAPQAITGMVVSPSWLDDHTAVAFTQSGEGKDLRITSYSCTLAFDCSARLATFPVGLAYRGAWLAADFGVSRTMFVELEPVFGGTPRMYVSRDAGRTFAPLSKAQALLDAHVQNANRDAPPLADLASGPPGSRRLWMRIYGSPFASLPAAELYRSDDNGKTWARIAYRRIAQTGPRGAMQDLRVPPDPPGTLLAASADNHLFVNGITAGGWGVSCSANGGVTWATFCP